MAKRKQSPALAKIQREVKRIRAAHPGKSYQNALKEAGRNYKSGKTTKPRKKATKSKTKKAATMPRKKARKANASYHIKKATGELEEKMGDLYVKQFNAKGVRAKKKIGKQLREVKQKVRRLK
jgi:hypothetical protein